MAKKLFVRGNKAACVNKGKRKTTGRTAALLTLDRVLQKAENRQHLQMALERMLKKNPIPFFKNLVIPLIPKAALDRLETDKEKEVAARQREAALFEAKVQVTRALEDAGQGPFAEQVCRSLDRAYAEDCVTEIELDLGAEAVEEPAA